MEKFTDGIFTITSPIQHRRGTTEALESSGYIPAAGEIVIATDTGLMKAGDGVHSWSELPYSNQISSELESRIAALENILQNVGLLNGDNTQPDDSNQNIDETLDDIFAGNTPLEPDEPDDSDDDNGFNEVLDSIFNS